MHAGKALILRNVNPSTSSRDLHQLFSSFHLQHSPMTFVSRSKPVRVSRCTSPTHTTAQTQARMQRHVIVRFASREEAHRAYLALQNMYFQKHILHVAILK